MRRAAPALLSLALVIGVAAPAAAERTGNAWADLQASSTYSVWRPTYASGLRLQHAGPNLTCPLPSEPNLLAVYGTRSTRQFTLTEGNPVCSDIGEGQVVQRLRIRGARAELVAYCDPKGPRCSPADIRTRGGHLAVTLPAQPGRRATTIWVETHSATNLTASQLIRVARGLQPVG